MSKKLLADPAIAALVEKEVNRASVEAAKGYKAEMKAHLRNIKEMITNHAADAKQVGNKDGATRLKALGEGIVAQLKVNEA